MDQYIDFKSGVQHHIRNKFLEANGNNLPEAVEGSTYLADELNDFIRYCFDNFGDTLKERYRCSIGILAKIDSVDHPERYKSYNMSSMFTFVQDELWQNTPYNRKMCRLLKSKMRF